jgi:hypothetical protein
MNRIETGKIDCPCCGEQIELLVDCSIEHQEYIEDCQVCCRPITVVASVDESGRTRIDVRDGNS